MYVSPGDIVPHKKDGHFIMLANIFDFPADGDLPNWVQGTLNGPDEKIHFWYIGDD